MKVVTSHQSLDFDGLSAMIAYSKLYPDAQLILPSKLNQNVKAFYSLHKDTFQFIEKLNFSLDKITNLVLVDTRDINRIGKLSDVNFTEIVLELYDHHEHTNLPREADYENCELVGATTTLLVEELKSQNMAVTPLEATAIAIGIYEDTGNLTFSGTTARDAIAIAWLLDQGADVEIIQDYVTFTLTNAQKNLFDELLSNTEYFRINQYDIGVSQTSQEDYLSGAAALVHKLMEVENVDLFFIIVKMGNRVFIIGRSRRDEIDVDIVLHPFEGKGHPQAASAVVKNGDPEKIRLQLIESLQLRLPVPLTAESIMSSPVKTISSDTTVDEADRLLHKYGHNGLPVIEENSNKKPGELVGMISRRDIEKARHHGFGHSPVKGYMSRKVLTITPKTNLKEIQHLLVSNDIGRLPVLNNKGELIGIVTRTNLLKIQHGHLTNETDKTNLYLNELDEFSEDITDLMSRRLPDKVLGFLYLIGQKADREGYKVYGVGGFVRDLLLGSDNLDVDLVVERDSVSFAKLVKQHLGGELKTFPQFQTACLILPSGSRIDFATARVEFYAFPAASPEVEESTIKQDLYRRDFTINTLAVELNGSSFGKLLDFFGGKKDLKNSVIRVLYNLSFVEDPIRIFRAIRFASRFNFHIEDQTLMFIKNSLDTGVLDKLPGERLYEELRNIIYESNPIKSIRLMEELGVFNNLFPHLTFDENKLHKLKNMFDILSWYENQVRDEKFISKEALILSCLLKDQPVPIISSILDRLKTPYQVRKVVLTTLKKSDDIYEQLDKTNKNSELAQNLEELPLETILFVLSEQDNHTIKKKIYYYLEQLKGVGVSITGEDLKSLGIQPGPAYKSALEEVRKARLDGIVTTPEEELEYVLNYFEQKGENQIG